MTENYTIQNLYKKSVEEVLIFKKNDNEIRITIGFRWGSVFATLNDEQVEILRSLKEDESIDVYDEFSADLNYLDDGWFENIEFSGEISASEKRRLSELWEENSFEALESEGWYQIDTELWFIGPLDLKLNND